MQKSRNIKTLEFRAKLDALVATSQIDAIEAWHELMNQARKLENMMMAEQMIFNQQNQKQGGKSNGK